MAKAQPVDNPVVVGSPSAHMPVFGGPNPWMIDHRFAFDRALPLWQWRAEPIGETSMERMVAKPEWGTKRICPSCGTRYYDLLREPVICPKCSTPYDPEAFLKSRRARPIPPVEKELEPVGAEELDTELETEEADVVEEEEEAVPLEEAEEEDEELLEDASELGEDEDDMAEVIENVEEEEH
jgi:uncharacterized protein (TIGR02300 family)